MLNDEEISILALLRGLHFTSTILKIPRENIIKIIANANYQIFFEKIRKEIIGCANSEGNQSAVEKFKIEKQRLDQLKLFEKSLQNANFEKINTEAFSHPNNSAKIITGINIKKAPKPTIIKEYSAVTKEFLMHEAEKSTSRYSICETYNIDREVLKTWTRSFHRTGVIKTSKRKFLKASDILQKAYNQIKVEREFRG